MGLWSGIPAGQWAMSTLSLVAGARLRASSQPGRTVVQFLGLPSCWRNWDGILVEGNAGQVAYSRRVRRLRKLVIIKTMGLYGSC